MEGERKTAMKAGQVCRDVRVQILSWFQTFLLFTNPHFQTFNALKSTSFQAYQIIPDFFSQTLPGYGTTSIVKV